ncbi:MAG: primosomal protein N' [Mariprofundaceae bacterium]
MRYVRIAVFAPLPGAFTYRWPAMLGEPVVGVRVRIPFGNGARWGVVLGEGDAEDVPPERMRDVADRLDGKPILDPVRQDWLARVGRYWLAEPGALWETALGWSGIEWLRRFRAPAPERLARADARLGAVFPDARAITLKTARNRARRAGDDSGLVWRVMQASASGLLEELPPDSPFDEHKAAPPDFAPNTGQRRALQALNDARGFAPFLLFGRTGSGKTEVYLRAAARRVAEGGQVLILVPEIGLTPMWLARLRAYFRRVLVWHSGLEDRERLRARMHLDAAEVLIGTRSALFLPLPRLAMIVIDEEHDPSFKQQEGLPYSARDAAMMLAQGLGIPLVMGSATPSAESWRLAKEGRVALLRLDRRAAADGAPVAIEVVDMRGETAPVSGRLADALRKSVARGDQAMLFLNRRGYAPALQCMACGEVPECPHCAVRLTLHRRAGRLRCHACGHARAAPKVCPACGEAAFHPLGEGTERIEDWLREHLPELRFARFDRDAFTTPARMLEVLEDFAAHRLDCLVGTQMLVKGHDFPKVSLIGVVNADQGMHLPDFRAGERWWQQLTQVIGRAGRAGRPARALIQTRSPDAPWLARLDESAAESVLDEELDLRRAMGFPPFARWVRIVMSARKRAAAEDAAHRLAQACARAGLDACGPMPCAIERLAGQWRIELLLRDTLRKLLPWRLAPVLQRARPPREVRMRVDVDPLEMM